MAAGFVWTGCASSIYEVYISHGVLVGKQQKNYVCTSHTVMFVVAALLKRCCGVVAALLRVVAAFLSIYNIKRNKKQIIITIQKAY